METNRGDAAAATWIVRGDESRLRRGRSVETGARLRYTTLAKAHDPGLAVARLHFEKLLHFLAEDPAFAGLKSATSSAELFAVVERLCDAADRFAGPMRTWYHPRRPRLIRRSR